MNANLMQMKNIAGILIVSAFSFVEKFFHRETGKLETLQQDCSAKAVMTEINVNFK